MVVLWFQKLKLQVNKIIPNIMLSQMQIVKSIKTYMSLYRVFCNDGNLREEPKLVVFLSQLLELFRVCATCRSPDILVEVKEFGTMVQVETTCSNNRCLQRSNIWKSQPLMPGTLNLCWKFAVVLCNLSCRWMC